MRGQLCFLREAGFDVTVVTAPGPELDDTGVRENVRVIGIPMVREMAPLQDLLSLWRLWRAIRRLRPDVINAGTPKAGLLMGIAAWLSRVPCRIYTLHGLRLETTRGLERKILWFCELLACACAHRVISVSESLRQEAVRIGIVRVDRIKVLASGSCNGVDVTRFAPCEKLSDRAAALRRKWNIPRDSRVLGFVGRFTRDKGIAELIKAYDILRLGFPELRLLLVGDFESGDPISPDLRHRVETDPRIIRPGFVRDIEAYYHLMSILVLPTYREGLGNAILEAHAAGKPAVATRATGVVDAIVDGATGLMVPVGDSEALAEACACLLSDPDLAAAMGRAGRERVLREFRQEAVWKALLQEYLELLSEKGLPLALNGDGVLTTARTFQQPSS
jgi:glycosyltransferase involved in cell wall biosynthesis